MEDFKLIFKGRLDFGGKRSYDKVLNMYRWKLDNHYKKNDIHIPEEELFEEETVGISFVKPKVTYGTAKNYKSCKSLFAYLSGYAIAGYMELWNIHEGKVKEYTLIEPTSDRAAALQFKRGRNLFAAANKEEALAAFDEAILKYENHALAYERRGTINMQLKKYHDAIRDYTKSINIYAGLPDPYYGRGIVHFIKEDFEESVKDFDTAIKRSIPLQAVHWKARRRKAVCLMKLNIFDEAAKELRFFNNRKFEDGNPNLKYRKSTLFNYGICLSKLNEFDKAAEYFKQSLKEEGTLNVPEESEIMYQTGMSMQKAGISGFEKYLTKAAKGGHVKAADLLETV